MNKQSRLQLGKKPVYRLRRIGYATDALLRLLGLTDFSGNTSAASRRIGGKTQMALIPIRLPFGRGH